MPETPAISISNLHKTYPKRTKKAVDGLCLTIEKGDFFGLLGPNGAGKSTTLNILSQLLRKDQGDISILGFDIDRHPFEAKNFLGIVPQEVNFNLFETPYDIVMQQGGYYGYRREELKDKLNDLFDRLDLHPHAHRPSRTLSGGMKRRLMVARGLIHNPSILILDEPTAGVDVQLRHETWDFLRELNAAGTTIILTSHYLEEIELLCRNVGIINQGKLLSQTSTNSLMQQVDGECYEISLKTPLSPAQKKGIEKAAGWTVIDIQTVQLSKSPQDDLLTLLALVSQNGVLSVKPVTQRLEEVFLSIINQPQETPA